MDDVMKTNGGCLHDLVTLAIHHRDDPEICADDHRNLFVCDRSPSGGHQQKCGKQRIASSDLFVFVITLIAVLFIFKKKVPEL